MASPTGSHIDSAEAFQKTFGVSRETLGRLNTYDGMLKRWQNTVNLVAPSTVNHVWHRHFADSAQLWAIRRGVKGLPLGGAAPEHWLDLGSGAGFPGLVIAILAAETGGTRHTLVESDSRKAAFLREVAREARVAVDILCMRIENPETRARVGEVNRVTARALAPLPRLVELAFPFFGSTAVGIFAKGREVASEIEETTRAWNLNYELFPSLTDADGRVLLLKSLSRKR